MQCLQEVKKLSDEMSMWDLYYSHTFTVAFSSDVTTIAVNW